MPSESQPDVPLLYHAFISYSRADRAVAKTLQARLEGYVLPQALRLVRPGVRHQPRPLRPVFRDEDELVPGQDLPQRIRAGLRAAEYLIVVCSPRSARSEWVEREILDFAALGRRDNIIAVVVDGDPHASERGQDPALECLPAALRFELEPGDAEGGGAAMRVSDRPAEPLWVDWRGASGKDRTMFLRVVAALLSLSRFDDLIGRDAQDRRRRAIAWSAAAAFAAVAVVFASVGLAYLVRQQNINNSEALAVIAGKAANEGLYDRAARYARAAFTGWDWPLMGFEPWSAEAELRNAVARSTAVAVLRGHDNAVREVAFSPDGARLVTASKDGTARLWNARTGAPIGAPMRQPGEILKAIFTPDGRRLATAAVDGARLWDAHTGAPIGVPMATGDSPIIAFSPDGALLATDSFVAGGRIWDARTGAQVGSLPRLSGEATEIAFSPDSARVVTQTYKTAELWDLRTGAQIGASMENVVLAVFSHDGTTLVTITGAGVEKFWDGHTATPTGAPPNHPSPFSLIAFSPDSALIATASDDKMVRIWDTRTGLLVGAPMPHAAKVTDLAFSPDGSRLATSADDRAVRLWDASTGASIGEPLEHVEKVNGVAFSPDGAYLATASDDRAARVWSLRASVRVAPLGGRDPDLVGPIGLSPTLNAVAISPDGAKVVTVSSHDTARIWNARTGAPIGAAMSHDGLVIAVAFSPDGTRVATASQDSTARLWDAATGLPIGAVMRHSAPLDAVAFSPDGIRLATTADDNTARLWDARTGAPIGPPMKHSDIVRTVVFSPDGTRLATASDDKTARLWDATSGAPIGAPMRHDAQVTALAFSPDGRRLATASVDDSARQWDARTGAPIGPPMRHESWANAVAYSPDGNRLATASQDDTARLWDTRTGLQIGAPMRHADSVRDVVFSPDGTRLATASDDQTVRLWDVRTHTPLAAPVQTGAPAMAAAFSPDGLRLAAAAGDKAAWLWWLQPALTETRAALLREACAVTLANGLSRLSLDEFTSAPELDPALDADVCHPQAPWALLGRLSALGRRR